MYSLNCDYYQKSFETLNELLDDVLTSGMDPSYEITRDGANSGETPMDLITP